MDQDRIKFIHNAEDYWKRIREGSSKAASITVRANDKIVARWLAKDSVVDFLSPMLTHDSAAVRFAAAAHLINYDAKEPAIAVLRDLVKDPRGLISPSASAILRIHKIPEI